MTNPRKSVRKYPLFRTIASNLPKGTLMDVQIDLFTMQHYDQVLALWKHSPGIGLSEADARDNIRRYLERNPGSSFVALVRGRVVGAVLGGHDGRRGYLHHLAVRSTRRRQGIARVLLQYCLNALRAVGIHKVHLFLLNENAEGAAFWKHLGWTLREDIGVVSLMLEPARSSGVRRPVA